MKTFSYSQQQLLKILQISPLQLDDKVSFESVTSKKPSERSILKNIQVADINSLLAQDIIMALPDHVHWDIVADAKQPEIIRQQLITPPLEQLQHVEQKKTLWALLSSL